MTTAVAPTGKTPQPLPGSKNPKPLPGTPARWAGIDLARITVSNASGDDAKVWTDQAKNMPTKNLKGIDTKSPLFVKAGTSFAETIDAAVARAASRQFFGTQSVAQAVLQAKDGTYFLTALGAKGTGTWASFDIPNHRYSVERLTNDLKAIVGARSWVNFTRQKIDPNFAASEAPDA